MRAGGISVLSVRGHGIGANHRDTQVPAPTVRGGRHDLPAILTSLFRCRLASHGHTAAAAERLRGAVADTGGRDGELLSGRYVEGGVNVLSLFSGIGGLDLGFKLANPTAQTIMFCEIDPYCRLVLEKRFPGIPIWEDIYDLTVDTLAHEWHKKNKAKSGKEVPKEAPKIDVITAGFP